MAIVNRKDHSFPFHGILGIALLLISEIFLFKKIEPVYSWFYCFAWWSYILIIDAFIYRLKGNSLMLSRAKEFFLMVPWSILIWLIFETANFSLENWYYIDLPHSTVERWLGYAIAYGTVLPGLFETAELLESVGLFKESKAKRIDITSGRQILLILSGAACLLFTLTIPKYFFCLLWVAFIFLLEPINYRFGGRSLLQDLKEGNPRKIYLLLIAGLICGFLWEFWNFWARSKWVYTVPFFEKSKGFEMPFAGFFGFPLFAIETYVIYNFISLFRHGRGWEESAYRLLPEKRTPLLTTISITVLIGSFSILIFKGIDLKTVDTYYPKVEDAYWIEPRYRSDLPKVGIRTLEDLLFKTSEKKERNDLVLRLHISEEELHRWLEKTQWALLKGLGIENLRILEQAGIHSISALAAEDPEKLYDKMKKAWPGQVIPRKAKIRIWIREAQKRTLNDKQ